MKKTIFTILLSIVFLTSCKKEICNYTHKYKIQSEKIDKESAKLLEMWANSKLNKSQKL